MNGCCTGAADGGVQHRRAGVEAEFVRHVRTRPEQRHNERLPRTGEPPQCNANVQQARCCFRAKSENLKILPAARRVYRTFFNCSRHFLSFISNFALNSATTIGKFIQETRVRFVIRNDKGRLYGLISYLFVWL